MTNQKEREQFIATMTREGLGLEVIRALMRAGTTLHRLAELECSSEAADRDRVRCPAGLRAAHGKGIKAVSQALRFPCLCRDYGSWDGENGVHGSIPRIALQSYRVEQRVVTMLEGSGIRATFQGDPRGAVIRLHVPSGKDEAWGGVAVP